MKGKIKVQGFLCKTSQYGESSLILKVYTQQHGMISLIAKGIRKQDRKNQLIVLNLYEFTVYEPQDGALYLMSEFFLLREYELTGKIHNWVAAECAVDLYSQLMIPHDEQRVYYELLGSYLDYLDTLESNAWFVWWRFMLRIFTLLGIPWDTITCARCQKEGYPETANTDSGELLCSDCCSVLDTSQEVKLTPIAKMVLYRLTEIGNYMNSIKLDKDSVRQINSLVSDHYRSHFHTALKIRSLTVWEDLSY